MKAGCFPKTSASCFHTSGTFDQQHSSTEHPLFEHKGWSFQKSHSLSRSTLNIRKYFVPRSAVNVSCSSLFVANTSPTVNLQSSNRSSDPEKPIKMTNNT